MQIRPEQPGDVDAIRALITASFAGARYRSGTEAAIVDALRAAGVLAASLVAEDAGEIVGHIAFSPVEIDAAAGDWYGLAPVAVAPDRQRRGVGQALIRMGLEQLRARGASGCVVLGEPAYYGRFGFESDPALRYGDVPAAYFQRLVFKGAAPSGQVRFQASFEA